jgi:xylan 1,4-beta-xylosidase
VARKPFSGGGQCYSTKDYDKWGALVKNITEHFTQRYSTEEVKTWYFEVWNEPNLSPVWMAAG